MHTLTMPLADALLASKALLNHVSTDKVTPVITQAAIVEHNDNRYLVATDRYSFGRFLLGRDDTFTGDPGQMFPRDALTWVSKINVKQLRKGWLLASPLTDGGYGIRFTWTPGEGHGGIPMELDVAIIVSDKVERSQTFDVASGNYPPVVRLWRDDDQETHAATNVALSATSLSKIASDVALFESRDASAVLQFDAKEGKHGPVQYTLGKRWQAAVQPSMRYTSN